jgi:TRAP-type transport system small permease protein
MISAIRKLTGASAYCLERICAAFFAAICFIVLYQVIARFVLKIPTPWTEELARYLLVLLTFLGACISIREETHLIALNILSGRSPRVEKIGRLVVTGILLAVNVVFTRNSFRMSAIAGTEMASSMVWLRTSYLYDIIALGFLMSCLFSASLILEILVGTARETATC